MKTLSLVAALVAEAVVHFDNGMVGCITKGGRIALVDKAGVATKLKYMPLVEDYLVINSPVQIEHSVKVHDDYHFETVWVDDEWDFENKCWDFDGLDYEDRLESLEQADALLTALFKCRVTEVRLAA